MKLSYFCTAFAALLLTGCVSISSKGTDSSAADMAQVTETVVEEGAQYGGIKKEYVVKGCQVTIYNDGPVQMIDQKNGKPCNAPLPKDHQFSKNTRTYQENGCMITESVAADGLSDAVMDCSKKK